MDELTFERRDTSASPASDSQPLYRQLADHYRRAIGNGVLRAGDRMPSMRAFMQRHGVSLATATESYRVLERVALIEARPRSGYFVRAPLAALPAVAEPDPALLPGSAQFVGIHATISALVSKFQRYPQALNLGGTTASPDLYPTEALRQATLRALRREPTLLTAAGPDFGDPALRAVIARRVLESGIEIGADEVIMTHGGIEAVNLALRAVTQPGDTVAVESPCFFGLLQVLESLGLRALEIPASPSTGLAIDALSFALQHHPDIKAVVVVPNLQNPLGSVMPDAHKASLVELCTRAGVALIEDDPYRELVDGEPAPKSLKAWDTNGTVIHCTSFNKTLAPGMRIGWINGGRWHPRVGMLKFAQSRHNERLAQVVLAGFLETGAYARHLRRLRDSLRLQRERMAAAITVAFPEGTRFTSPRGGQCFWVELPAALSSAALFDAALDDGLRIMPGTVFSNTGRFDHFIRLSCPSTDLELLDDAVRRLGSLARRMLERGDAHTDVHADTHAAKR
ncbi:aminotransferase-like domain-containing protein [Paraburkholderia antibiotica]|uniref:PLP-dependent aminotransferase family protein n=1 Tax=Paraburkholderia antibiotica TaxID=2728839 RepID=A0A7X9X4G5_9BURK|nr:PLP-dependent aminotransferase family protein [Paraburkholderia antibiotica]NML31274.1 PLP-dependent aminotransferase family protein [Paraburkholderia antibiotica]